jgi:hypothetical protein
MIDVTIKLPACSTEYQVSQPNQICQNKTIGFLYTFKDQRLALIQHAYRKDSNLYCLAFM